MLGDAGLLGLAAAIVLVACIAWFAGPWRSRTTTGRVAAYLLIGLAVGGLFEDLTFVPAFNLLVIVLVAVALTGRRRRRVAADRARRALLVPAGAAALVLLAGMVVADAGAIAYRAGTDAAARGDWEEGASLLERSVEIDPWHPAGPKSLAVAAERAGRDDLGAGTRPSPPSSPATTPATRRRGSTSPSSARSRATPTARHARPSERWPRPASSRPELLNAAISLRGARDGRRGR